MNYETANLLLNLLVVGIERHVVQTRLEAAKASGVPDSEVPKLLRQWRDEAIAEASSAGH